MIPLINQNSSIIRIDVKFDYIQDCPDKDQIQFLQQCKQYSVTFIDEIGNLLKQYRQLMLNNSNFLTLVPAMQISNEIHQVFSATADYLINLLFLSYLQNLPKSSTKNEKQFKEIQNFKQKISKLNIRNIISVFQQNIPKNNRMEQIITFLQDIKLKNATTLPASKEHTLNATIDSIFPQINIDMNFTQQKDVFIYDIKEYSKMLQYVANIDPLTNNQNKKTVQQFIQNNPQLSIQQLKIFTQTIINNNSNIVLQNNVDIKMESLLNTITGQSSNYSFIISPDQLFPLLLDFPSNLNIVMLHPMYISPFIINEHLFYQVTYDEKVINKKSYLFQLCDNTKINTDIMLQKILLRLQPVYKSILLRHIFIAKLSTYSIMISQENQKGLEFEFKFLSVQPFRGTHSFDCNTEVVVQNFQHQYLLQYKLMNILIQNQMLQKVQTYDSSLKFLQNLLGKDYQILSTMNVKEQMDYCIFILNKTFSVCENIIEEQNKLSIKLVMNYSLIKTGFLRLDSEAISSYLSKDTTYFTKQHFDLMYTWQNFINLLKAYYHQNNQQNQNIYGQTFDHQHVKDFLLKKLPKITSFFERNLINFDYTGQIYCDCLLNAIPITQKNAKATVIAAVHELQQLTSSSFKAKLKLNEVPVLYQVLANATAISPSMSSLRFQFDDNVGIDAGGMYRQTMQMVFDDLIQEKLLTEEVFNWLLRSKKFSSSRKIDVQELIGEASNPPSVLHAVNDVHRTYLLPHYEYFTPQTSSCVKPRLTEKRSALYYLGRIVAFCFVSSIKVPRTMHDNFFKALVGGRLFFDDQLEEQYKTEIILEPMILVNGTQSQQALAFKMSNADLTKFYKQQIQQLTEIVTSTQVVDLDMIGMNAKYVTDTVKSLYKLNLNNFADQKKYAEIQLNELKSGDAFKKSYSEFRNGFRQSFGNSMNRIQHNAQNKTIIINQIQLAQTIDRCMEFLDYQELQEILTYDQHHEELLNRNDIVLNLFQNNIGKIEDQELYLEKLSILQRVINIFQDKNLISHKDLLDCVYACTGNRNLENNSIVVKFQAKCPEKRFIEYHTCTNMMIMPLEYCQLLTTPQLVQYIIECQREALKNGFALT